VKVAFADDSTWSDDEAGERKHLRQQLLREARRLLFAEVEMKKKTAKKGTPGRTSQFSELYQLHLDVGAIARQLRERQRKGHAPLKKHVAALYEVSTRLKLLDKNPDYRFDDLEY
jgi:hypothetical protein